ncbi:MAG: DUF4446 family protein [bacterium]|nr:DUF4446 family protein [bacterium]MCP4964036.1 DUF4446 family protein [bacterium]
MIEIAMVVAIVALVGVIVVAFQANGLRKRLDSVPADENVFAILKGVDNELGRLDAVTASYEPRLAAVEHLIPHAIVNTGVVNYDAFGDIAGNLSRSLALLSVDGDGVVLSILVGRLDVRVYTKEVRDFRGVEELSPEEMEAVTRAGGQ